MKNLFVISAICCLAACQTPQGEQQVSDPEAVQNQIFISTEQLSAINYTQAQVTQSVVSNVIRANGKIHIPPNKMTHVSSYLGGVLSRADLIIGDAVQKGQVLAVLNSAVYIDLQQEYIALLSKLAYDREEYERQQTLRKEEINSEKALTRANSALQTTESQLHAVREKLKLSGANIEKVEKGEITSHIYLRAPYDGFVDEVMISQGAYVEPNRPVYTIIDPSHKHLELSIYEQDADKIHVGQTVSFTVPGHAQEFLAEIYLIGKSLTEERVLPVHCHLADESFSLPIGTYVEAKITIGEQSARRVPSSAMVISQDADYVLTELRKTEYGTFFERIPVQRGAEASGYTEISSDALFNAVVDGGSYFIASAISNQEEGS